MTPSPAVLAAVAVTLVVLIGSLAFVLERDLHMKHLPAEYVLYPGLNFYAASFWEVEQLLRRPADDVHRIILAGGSTFDSGLLSTRALSRNLSNRLEQKVEVINLSGSESTMADYVALLDHLAGLDNVTVLFGVSFLRFIRTDAIIEWVLCGRINRYPTDSPALVDFARNNDIEVPACRLNPFDRYGHYLRQMVDSRVSRVADFLSECTGRECLRRSKLVETMRVRYEPNPVIRPPTGNEHYPESHNEFQLNYVRKTRADLFARFHGFNEKLVATIADTARRHGIEAVFVQQPSQAREKEAWGPENNAIYWPMIERAASANGLAYWNLEPELAMDQHADFVDPYHFTYAGRVKFQQELEDAIVERLRGRINPALADLPPRKTTHELGAGPSVSTYIEQASGTQRVLLSHEVIAERLLDSAFVSRPDGVPGNDFVIARQPADRASPLVLPLNRMPTFELDGARALTVRIRYGKHDKQIGNFSTARWRIEWLGEDGAPIAHLLPAELKLRQRHYPLEDMLDVFEDVVVPFTARQARLVVQMTSQYALRVRQVSVAARQFETRPRATRIALEEHGDARTAEVTFTAFTAPPASPVTGLFGRVVWSDVTAVRTVDERGAAFELEAGRDYLFSRFTPSTMHIVTAGGSGRDVWLDGHDTVQARFDADAHTLVLDVYSYDLRERSYPTHELPPKVGTNIDPETGASLRHNRNLGATTLTPELSFTLTERAAGPPLLSKRWHPDARLATFIFTEHADYFNPAADRMLMYGNREGRLQTGAGLLGRGLPTTKTVFTSGDPWKFEIGGVRYVQASLEVYPEGLDLLRRYAEHEGLVEIGLHSPSPYVDDAQAVREGMHVLSEFRPRVWIDHGSDTNIEALERLGWRPDKADYLAQIGLASPPSGYYILGLLREHGYDLAWRFEDRFAGGNLLKPNEASQLLFYVPELDDILGDDWQLRIFTSESGQRPTEYTAANINALLDSHGIWISHCYLHWHPFITYAGGDSASPVGLSEHAEKFLDHLAERRDAGVLNVSTLGRWADYVAGMRRVSIVPDGDGVILRNPGRATLPGASFAVTSTDGSRWTARVAGHGAMERRPTGGGSLVALDLPPGDTRIEFEPLADGQP